MKITIKEYPCTFSFNTRKKFDDFETRCKLRDTVLYEKMEELKVDSPYHSYGDYVVEDVKITPEGEIWTLGS